MSVWFLCWHNRCCVVSLLMCMFVAFVFCYWVLLGAPAQCNAACSSTARTTVRNERKENLRQLLTVPPWAAASTVEGQLRLSQPASEPLGLVSTSLTWPALPWLWQPQRYASRSDAHFLQSSWLLKLSWCHHASTAAPVPKATPASPVAASLDGHPRSRRCHPYLAPNETEVRQNMF